MSALTKRLRLTLLFTAITGAVLGVLSTAVVSAASFVRSQIQQEKRPERTATL